MDSKIISTELRYEAGKTTSLFENRPPVDLVGLKNFEDHPQEWTPPHLFLASIESCFLLTLLSIAEKMRIKIKSFSSTIEGKVSSADGKHQQVTEIVIRPSVKTESETDHVKIKMLCEKAEEYCLVARTLNTKVKIEI
ncbi:MAG: OsmC family protein [Pseudomonadota bacterium]